ncbi:nitrate reductase cytochrome c-type subunit [Aliiroseovarius sp. S1339]|uniref:nitrate reductase cytochrome c-type subunit n=1 Tax=Aliiroseovarius sp. S1339 TaxID=2936990 RepID=UPI0020BE7DB4|nr:nitrate reductase cytochrome c-type subunit [Aliiroseovarius sp. S1339]MCK8464706.1 nitrate reductase cytochrome c-type subunit [Aliiroseovarius sp. S1339]
MKKTIITALVGSALLVGAANAQSSVETLRDGTLDEAIPANRSYGLDEKRFTRNYRQQPPLIPHAVDQYQVDLKTNRCLSCHDWTTAGERSSPTLSMTHYLDRDGNQLDTVAGTRWFCSQCHVPQVDAPALVDNTFKASN